MTPDPTVLIGRCTVCPRVFRVEIPASIRVLRGEPWQSLRYKVKAAGFPMGCDCRDGVRCAEDATGLPACGDWRCDGHWLADVKWRILKATFKAEVICGPGNCWGAISSTCTCSCGGKNHGRQRAITMTAPAA